MTKTQFISIVKYANLDGTLFHLTDSDAATTKSFPNCFFFFQFINIMGLKWY